MQIHFPLDYRKKMVLAVATITPTDWLLKTNGIDVTTKNHREKTAIVIAYGKFQ